MKNKILPAITLLAVALAFASPSLASANSNRNDHDDNRNHNKVKVNLSVNNDHSDKENKRDKDDDKSHNNINLKVIPKIEKRLDNGKNIPNSWLQFLENLVARIKNRATTTASTTPDVTAPKINSLQAVAGTSTADIVWKTSEVASSELRYSTSSDVNASSSSIVDGSLLFNHNVHLVNLTPNTKYYYVVVAKDSMGNIKAKETRSFKTLPVTVTPVPPTPVTDTTAPTIQFNMVFDINANSAKVFWVTNEPADSKVWVSTSTPVSSTGTSTVNSTVLVNYHNLSLNNLATSTTYYYLASSSDSSGNTSTTTGSFVTSSF